jgi:Xaa-Pro aminopeptidase
MVRTRQLRCWPIVAICLALASPLAAGPRFDNAEYAARRSALMAKIGDGVAVVWGAQPIASYYRYSQNNDFMYLTGAEIPNAVLIVDGGAKASTLLFTSTEAAARAEGIPAELVRNPKEFTGVERVAPIEVLDSMLSAVAGRGKSVYTAFRPEELYRESSMEKLRTLQSAMTLNKWDGRLTRELQFVKLFRERFPLADVKDVSPLIWELRTIKSPAEIALLRRAGRIGAAAHTATIEATRPGQYEYELSALFNYECEKQGAQESAYGVIVSSGENHPYVHYNRHDRQLKDGDFIVVDAGPDLDYYDIDITTSFPANGRFTPRQREVYEASLAVHEANLKVYRPGLTLEQCRKEVAEILAKQGFDLTKNYFKRMQGGFGHYVGMATHDVGGGPQVLKPGMVFANEPYMTWPGEDLGVRVEDTILITETGCENLTPGIPRTVKEIEDAMRQAKR